MVDSIKSINLHIPEEMQQKIDNGDYKLYGSEVRDKRGRMVCNLKTLEIDEQHYFSPQLFISFEQYTFVANSAVSKELEKKLESIKQSFLVQNDKIDQIIQRQENNLISKITDFNVHFLTLEKKSILTDEKNTFKSAVESASLIAQNIQLYIDCYIGETIVYQGNEWQDKSFSQYSNDQNKYKAKITKSKFNLFTQSKAFYFSLCFIDIINKLNILSLTYDERTYEKYIENLSALKEKLTELLIKLIYGLGIEGDIYQMAYTKDSRNYYCKLDIEKLLKYDSKNDINSIIVRDYGSVQEKYFDENRLSSIYSVITILEDIDNLIKRSDDLKDMDIPSLVDSDIKEIKRLIFNAP